MEMDLIKVFLFVTIISLVYLQSDINNVSKCPLTEEKWNEASKNYTCNIVKGKGKSYHCLRTTIGGFLEGCFAKSGISFSEGCPVFHMEKGRLTLRYIKCNDSKGCPDTARTGAFPSDKVYTYPSCIKQVYISESSSSGYGSTGQTILELNVSLTVTTTSVKEDNSSNGHGLSTFITVVATSDVNEDYSNGIYGIPVIIVVGSLVVIVFLLGVCAFALLIFICKRKQSDQVQGQEQVDDTVDTVEYNGSYEEEEEDIYNTICETGNRNEN